MLENWAAISLLCSTRAAHARPLKRIDAVKFSLQELDNDKDAWRAQEKCIDGIRGWVDEVVITDVGACFE